MKTVETERLLLRPWAPDDLEDFYEYASMPEVGPDAGWEPHRDRDASEAILRSFIEQDETWALVYRPEQKVVGSVGLHRDDSRTGVAARMLGYVLSTRYWGRGLMTEAARAAVRHAFEYLELDVLSVSHYPFNLRSKRVIEKCGFVCEGTLRHAAKIYNGNVYDKVVYSMLRQEYFAAVR